MEYLITSDLKTLEAYQAQVDEKLGYPEPDEDFQNVGLGPWAPFDLGRAKHYAEITKHEKEELFMLPLSASSTSAATVEKAEIQTKDGAVDVATLEAVPREATVADKLPDDWYPKAEMP